ncbi:hypothetical protein [Geopseudomonas aromaticivorans]
MDIEKTIRSQKGFNPYGVPGERLMIDRDLTAYFKSIINVESGRASLTNYRIVFCEPLSAVADRVCFPIITGIADMLRGGHPKIYLQIMLSEIALAEEKKHGFGKKVVFTMTDGKRHTLSFKDIPHWKSTLGNLGVNWP